MANLDDTSRFSLGLDEWVNVMRRGALFQLPLDLDGLSLYTAHLADLRSSQNLEVNDKAFLQERRSSSSATTPPGLNIREISIPVSTDLQNQTSADWTGKAIQARVYTPNPNNSCVGPYPLVVYFRGIGGWVVGDLETEDETCRQIATLSRSVVVNVEYRKAPNFKYPTPLQDCWDAVKWVRESDSD
jgi:acetyl esterase/lipase